MKIGNRLFCVVDSWLRLLREFQFQLIEPATRGAYQILNRSITRAHCFKHFFDRGTATHHPRAFGCTILPFNLLQKCLQSRLIQCIPGHHPIGQWQAFSGHGQSNDYLQAIGAGCRGYSRSAS